MSANRDSPRPRTTGDSARCISSIAPASRYWRTVETPPPIFTSRSPAAALAWAERRLDPVGHEVERRPAVHHDRCPGVMREDEGRRVIRGIIAPPALPVGAAPIVAGRPEHVAAEDEGAEAVHRGAAEAIIGPVGPAVLPDHRSKSPRREEPAHQLGPSLAERMLQALVRAGSETVEGHAETGYAHLAHGGPRPFVAKRSVDINII